MMRQCLSFLALLACAWSLEAHGYRFSQTPEEMRDQVWVHVSPVLVTVQYESIYLGQIAPHVRNMIDANADTTLTEEEVSAFFAEFGRSLNATLRQEPVIVDGEQFFMRFLECAAPGLLTDSLLAPLRLRMVFVIDSCRLPEGEHELIADPRLFFRSGNFLIDLAKERVAFTDEQERAIGRLLQLRVIGAPGISFVSCYPGYIKRELDMVLISGVFYDQTVLRIRQGHYPKLRIRFRHGGTSP
ncbi:MAG: hypothetical protein ACUVWA_08270 [Candidatus Oleimicrobiaceae bacterium]